MSARTAAERLVGHDVAHIESVPIMELFPDGDTWEGVVEVFGASDSPDLRIFLWCVMGDKGPEWIGTLGNPEITTAKDAVRSWLASHPRGS